MYRDLAVRVVAAACKLCGSEAQGTAVGQRTRQFDDHVISAFGEAFNNVALHAYDGTPPGDLDIEIDADERGISIRITDFGPGFDFDAAPEPDLDALPESGLGIFIIKSFMDEVHYQAGAPNVLTMKKQLGPPAGGAS
jgi:serine/threonine-protein kinase RsbW